ncbi:hypothetical protein HZC09_00035 [Candidatus Micrarchaeota archaeon]|nr:hypothetical protein [Candidatus Micrarchaeota archaeon]
MDRFEAPERPKWLDSARVPLAKQVDKLTPVTRLSDRNHQSYANLELFFRSWHPDATPEDLKKLWHAFVFMREAHKGRLRKDVKTKEEAHPYTAALYAAKAGNTLDEVIASLLHDTVEDCGVRVGEIKRRFGLYAAETVSLDSKPKIRLGVQTPWKYLEHEGACLPVVLPDDESYYREATREEDALEKSPQVKKMITDLYRDRLFNKGQPLTPLHRSAIWVRQWDTTHNLQTLKAYKTKNEVAAQIDKMYDAAFFFADRLSSVIAKSLPPKVREALAERWKQRYKSKDYAFKWILHLPDRTKLTFKKLDSIPPTFVSVVNRHHVVERGQVSQTKHELFIPYSLVGAKSFDKLQHELQFHSDPANNPLLRTKVEKGPAPENPIVRKGESWIPPGVREFHPFYFDFGGLRRKGLVHFKVLTKQALIRYSDIPFLKLVGKLVKPGGSQKDPFVHKVDKKGEAFWLESTHGNHVVSVFLPYKYFSPFRGLIELALEGFKERNKRWLSGAGAAFEPTHQPGGGIKPTFHTINLSFRKDLNQHQRNSLLRELADDVKSPLMQPVSFNGLRKAAEFLGRLRKPGRRR